MQIAMSTILICAFSAQQAAKQCQSVRATRCSWYYDECSHRV